VKLFYYRQSLQTRRVAFHHLVRGEASFLGFLDRYSGSLFSPSHIHLDGRQLQAFSARMRTRLVLVPVPLGRKLILLLGT